MSETSTALEQAKALTWGTCGPGAVEAFEAHGTPLPPMVYKPLGECDTDHLIAIIAHTETQEAQYNEPELIRIAVTLVLEDRRHSTMYRGGESDESYSHKCSNTANALIESRGGNGQLALKSCYTFYREASSAAEGNFWKSVGSALEDRIAETT